jgi:hypothetical protein
MWTQEGGKKKKKPRTVFRHPDVREFGPERIFYLCELCRDDFTSRQTRRSGRVHSFLASYPERPGFWSQSRYRLSHCRVTSSPASYSGRPWFESRSSYTDLNLTRVSSFPPDRCWYIILNYATTASIHSLTYVRSWALPEKLPIVQPFRKFPAILRNPKVHHHVHKRPPLVPILSQFDPVHTIPSYLS